MLKELNSYKIDQYAVNACSPSGTDIEHWAAMQIAKLNLCQLGAHKIWSTDGRFPRLPGLGE